MNISLVQIFGALLTIGVRLTGIMLFAPFLGSAVIPARVKAMLVITLTALLYPMLSAKIPALSISQWPMMVFSELLIGIALGIATNIVFDGVQMAGQVLSVQMGYSLVSILDPQTLAESTVVATFHQTDRHADLFASQRPLLDFARTGTQLRLSSSRLRPFRRSRSRLLRCRQGQVSLPSAYRLPHRCSPPPCLPTSRSACWARHLRNCRSCYWVQRSRVFSDCSF